MRIRIQWNAGFIVALIVAALAAMIYWEHPTVRNGRRVLKDVAQAAIAGLT